MGRAISIDSSTGELTVIDGNRQWNVSAKNRQIEKHGPMFDADIAQQLSRGDRQVVADIIAINIAEAKT